MIFQYTSKLSGAVKKINLIGELIERESPQEMIREINETLENGTVKILLNFKELKYINSSGLTVLLNILSKVNQAGGMLAICSSNERNIEVLKITKLTKKFNLCATEEDAVKLLSKK